MNIETEARKGKKRRLNWHLQQWTVRDLPSDFHHLNGNNGRAERFGRVLALSL